MSSSAKPGAKDSAPAPGAADDAGTFPVMGRMVSRAISRQLSRPDALNGQIGGTRTWLGEKGLPLTFTDADGETQTVYALKKPGHFGYDVGQDYKHITITDNRDGHGKELGMEVGWTLVAIGFSDITHLPWIEAHNLLEEKMRLLPSAVPLTWKPNAVDIADFHAPSQHTIYAYHNRLALMYAESLPIKILREKDGHGKFLGIKVGWELLAINYIDVSGKKSSKENFNELVNVLHRELDPLPPLPKKD